MLVRDANANFFIVFGGLYSRRCIEEATLKKAFAGRATQSLKQLIRNLQDFLGSGSNLAEVARLQPRVREVLAAAGPWKITPIGKAGDLLCEYGEKRLLVETKIQSRDRLDEARGSGVPYAEDQLLRDMNDRDVEWGILTNGWSWRFYNIQAPNRMIEFSVSDMVRSPRECPELDLFAALLSPDGTREHFLNKSNKQRHSSAGVTTRKIRGLFNVLLNSGWEKDIAVQFVLRICMQRFLEDCGILDTLCEGYQRRRLDLAKNVENSGDILSSLCDGWIEIASGRWTTPIEHDQKCPPLSKDFITAHEIRALKGQPKVPKLAAEIVRAIFDDNRSLDFSDLDIEFFGNFYQFVENPESKNDAGRYFTSFDLSKELASYLSERFSLRDVLREGEYVLDPACGSGQLLRLLIPFASNFINYNPENPTKLHHWRSFAKHLAGIDIDANSIWIAKVSLWLSTAAKGSSFVDPHIVQRDLVRVCAGVSRGEYSKALGFEDGEQVIAIISNPPWEELRLQFTSFFKKRTGKKRPSQRNKVAWEEYERYKKRYLAEFRKLSEEQNLLNLKLRQGFGTAGIPNLAEVFFRVSRGILQGTSESSDRKNLPYAVIMPDQFFIGTRMTLRGEVISELDAYIPFGRNIDPATGARYFFGVDPNRRFGIVLGKVGQRKKTNFVNARPIGKNPFPIPYEDIGMLPLPTHDSELNCLEAILRLRDEENSGVWSVGEWDGTNWEQRAGRSRLARKTKSAIPLIKAEGLTEGYELSFVRDSQVLWWVESSNKEDIHLATSSRLVVGDTKRNSGKVVFAGFIRGNKHRTESGVCSNGVAFQNKLLYCNGASEWLHYLNSVYFDLAVRGIAGASNLNAWRLNFLGFPKFSGEFLSGLNALTYDQKQVLIGRELGLSDAEIKSCVEAASWLKIQDAHAILEALELGGADAEASQAEEKAALERAKQMRAKIRQRQRRRG